MRLTRAAVTSLLTLALFSTPAVQAAYPALQPSQPVKDETLAKFAALQAKIGQIQHKYQKRIQRTASDTEEQELKAQANREIRQAIRNRGFSLSEYSHIAKRLSQDPALQKALKKRM